MVSSKVYISDPALSDLAGLSEANQGRFASTILFLEDDTLRHRMKDDMVLVERDMPVWAIETEHLFIFFVELEDKVEVTHIAGRSRFRPGSLDRRTENSVAELRVQDRHSVGIGKV